MVRFQNEMARDLFIGFQVHGGEKRDTAVVAIQVFSDGVPAVTVTS